MKEKYYLIFFLLFLITIKATSQVCGIVLNAQTKEPVPFATVSTTGFGTYTNSQGFFERNNHSPDSFTVSSIGYLSKQVFLTGSNKCDTIYLEPNPIQLPTIEIGNYPWLKNRYVDQISMKDPKETHFSHGVIEGVTIIKYFPHPDGVKKYIISNLSIRVTQKSPEYIARKVRIKIYEAKSPTEAGKDILESADIFTIEKPSGKYVEFDLNRFMTHVPPNGYFIGLEFLSPRIDAKNQGSLVIPGKLTKEYENGAVLYRFYTNSFKPQTFPPDKKVNFFINTRLYEIK